MDTSRLSEAFRLVRNFFFNAVNREFLIFLFFLFLSGAFWFAMTMNETYEKEISIPVRLDGIPRKVVVTSNTEDTIRVTLRDRGYILASYLYGSNLTPIHIYFNTFNKGNRHFSVFCRKPVNPVVFSCFNANKCRFFPEKKAKKERNPACFIKITIDFAPFLEYHYNRYGLFDTKRLKALIFRVGRPGTSAAQGRSNRFL